MAPAVAQAASNITSILEKYTGHMDLLDIIEIVDNLRQLVEMTE